MGLASVVAGQPVTQPASQAAPCLPSHQCPSACPAQLMGALIEKYGAGEGFGVLAADQNETW